MTDSLRMAGLDFERLRAHLYPGDGCEAVALALCGRLALADGDVLLVQDVAPVPYDACHERTPQRVRWNTHFVPSLLERAASGGLSLLKIHSHPGGYPRFSDFDDAADRDLFASVAGWVDHDAPHASAVMLPDGRIFGRSFSAAGEAPLRCVSVAGDDVLVWHADDGGVGRSAASASHAQLFGEGTTAALERLSVAVVGVSGTGGPLTEQLARLRVGEIVLVDPEVVEERNLNRIPNATRADAERRRPKVDVQARAIEAMGLGTRVVPVASSLSDPDVVRTVAACDLVVGCMDGVDGRHLLSRIATFYCLPYFDVGVKLVADGRGGVEQVCGTVHYLQPGRSSLLSRGVYTLDEVRAAAMKRSTPEAYERLVEEKYVRGVPVERPAVVSVNTLFASLAVNEILARLHPYRLDPNGRFAAVRFSLSHALYAPEPDGPPC
jgi:hypothetical protein